MPVQVESTIPRCSCWKTVSLQMLAGCFLATWLAAVGVAALGVAVGLVVLGETLAMGQEAVERPARPMNAFFKDEVWAKVGSLSCLKCHKRGGEAEDSHFILRDPDLSDRAEQAETSRWNQQAFVAIARYAADDHDSRLLKKVIGELDHGGKDVLRRDSVGYKILSELVSRVNAPPGSVLSDTASAGKSSSDKSTANQSTQPSMQDSANDSAQAVKNFWNGVVMLDDRRLLRRITLSFAGRLPTKAELEAVSSGGLKALSPIMDDLMREEAFYDRLREAFNDIFLTVGQEDNAETVLSYDHFSTTRLWYQKFDLSHIADEKERRQAGYKLANDYRRAILDEPMQLIAYIVKHDRPFTEIVTADYIMVTPYSARGYGVFDELKSSFKNPEDPFEYIPVKLKALVGRNKADNQDSATGFYPHAGLLSTFQYLRRYPTTETNRNRLRARMYYQHFLGIDALELAARVDDAAAVSAKYEIPTMQASECVVCHKTIDPVAGIFQDYWKFEGVYGRRKGGWFSDMFAAGFEGEELPEDQRWRALQWLGERTAKDPRFAVAMVEHVYYVLTGRKALRTPKQLDDPLYDVQQLAYQMQRKQIEAIAERFTSSGFNLKVAFKEWATSEFYRADGVALASSEMVTQTKLDDIGLVRILAPEQLERKVKAIFGERWGKLNEQMEMLYGGIDSKEVTERPADPSGAMGAIQRTLSNDLACRHTLKDFARPAAERRLFPNMEPDIIPGTSSMGDEKIRQAIVHLHELILGRYDDVASAEVQQTFDLLSGIVTDAQAQKSFEPVESYYCRQGVSDPPADPHYTIRAWRAVITYLLRRQEFLYE